MSVARCKDHQAAITYSESVLVDREMESGVLFLRDGSRHRAEGSCGIVPQRLSHLGPSRREVRSEPREATVSPAVSARGKAVGSVLTGALCSTHVASECTSDGNVR